MAITDRKMLHTALTGGGTIAKEWGDKCTLVRETHGISRKDLADKAGVDHSTIWKIEQGELAPSDHMKCLLASALNMPVDRLFPMPTVDRINELFLADEAAAA